MAATRADIEGWLSRGKREGATHVVVMVDRYDHEDYPVFVMPGEDARTIADKHLATHQMTGIMECYSLKLDLPQQLNERRVFNWN